jgi:hypothetical protein
LAGTSNIEAEQVKNLDVGSITLTVSSLTCMVLTGREEQRINYYYCGIKC